MTTLVHNNLRMMWHGLFSQAMADTFVHVHLMNQSEFFTTMPLPSIAINDYRFHHDPRAGNDWSGAVEGLTAQRAIRALESYGHYAELTLVGRALTTSLIDGCQSKSNCHFPQQIDPISGIPSTTGNDDGYGPMIISLLELTALRVGIMPRPQLLLGSAQGGNGHGNINNSSTRNGDESFAKQGSKRGNVDRGGLFWSGVADTGAVTTYNQTLGSGKLFNLRSNPAVFTAALNGNPIFRCTAGVRVVTDIDGGIVAVVGIDDVARSINLTVYASALVHVERGRSQAGVLAITVNPNQVYDVTVGIDGTMKATLAPSAPFSAPHSPPSRPQ